MESKMPTLQKNTLLKNDESNAKSGIYFIEAKTKNGIARKKFVKDGK